MGEMADYYVEQGIEQMLDDEFCEANSVIFCRRGYRTPVPPTCKTCRKPNLRWGQIVDKKIHYQLQERDGTPHVCDMSFAMPNLDEEEKS